MFYIILLLLLADIVHWLNLQLGADLDSSNNTGKRKLKKGVVPHLNWTMDLDSSTEGTMMDLGFLLEMIVFNHSSYLKS